MATKGTCRYCGRDVVWITTQSGEKAPVERRKVRGFTEGGELVEIREHHLAHCPNRARAAALEEERRKRLLKKWEPDAKTLASGG